MNMNSLIIYGIGFSVFAAGIIKKDLSGFFGLIAGACFIYFLLANKQDRENIRKNLTWRTK